MHKYITKEYIRFHSCRQTWRHCQTIPGPLCSKGGLCAWKKLITILLDDAKKNRWTHRPKSKPMWDFSLPCLFRSLKLHFTLRSLPWLLHLVWPDFTSVPRYCMVAHAVGPFHTVHTYRGGVALIFTSLGQGCWPVSTGARSTAWSTSIHLILLAQLSGLIYPFLTFLRIDSCQLL